MKRIIREQEQKILKGGNRVSALVLNSVIYYLVKIENNQSI
jgi:hypothetical protein